MKKYTLLILLAITIMLIIVGCGNSSSPSDGTTEILNFYPIMIGEDTLGISPRPEPIIIPEPPESNMLSMPISDFGRLVAEEFLSQYWSLFSFGLRISDGYYRNFHNHEEILLYRPLVLWDFEFYDRQGNVIEDSIFAESSTRNIALNFWLYDFDNDGIPEIIISGGILETCVGSQELFRFIDGEYRSMGTFKAPPMFFHDELGQVIAFYNFEMHSDVFGYYYFELTDTGMVHVFIEDTLFHWNHSHTISIQEAGEGVSSQWFYYHSSSEFFENPIMFNTGRPLTRISSLEQLENEIVATLRERYVYVKVEEVSVEPIILDPAIFPIFSPNVQISDFGRQVAEEFLSQFWTLYSFGRVNYDGYYSRLFVRVEFDEYSGDYITHYEILPYRPLVLWDNWSGQLYDRQGNRIEKDVFSATVAVSFALYDFDNSGIPDIVINWSALEIFHRGSQLFRFIDGKYRCMGFFTCIPTFLYDDDAGRVIVLYNLEMHVGLLDVESIGYYYFGLTNENIEHVHINTSISSPVRDWVVIEQWWKHHRNPEFFRQPNHVLYR